MCCTGEGRDAEKGRNGAITFLQKRKGIKLLFVWTPDDLSLSKKTVIKPESHQGVLLYWRPLILKEIEFRFQRYWGHFCFCLQRVAQTQYSENQCKWKLLNVDKMLAVLVARSLLEPNILNSPLLVIETYSFHEHVSSKWI